MLETAERLVAFEASTGNSTEAVTQRKRMALLSARAALPAGETLTVPPPVHAPTVGHRTARTDLMLGRRNGQSLIELSLRPAYHELLDPEDGFQRGAAIQFGKLVLGRSARGAVQLERLTPIEIASLSPREPLLSARSWRVDMGVQRSAHAGANGRRPLGLSVHGGPGAAWEWGPGAHTLAYAFLDNQISWDRSLPAHPWALGTGRAVGLLSDVSADLRVQAEAWGRGYLQSQPMEAGAQLGARWRLNSDWNLNARCQWRARQEAARSRECLLGAQRYW